MKNLILTVIFGGLLAIGAAFAATNNNSDCCKEVKECCMEQAACCK